MKNTRANMLLTIGIVLTALPGAVCAQSFLKADNATERFGGRRSARATKMVRTFRCRRTRGALTNIETSLEVRMRGMALRFRP